jgi:peptidoglycan LD-endopeptidase CwlK
MVRNSQFNIEELDALLGAALESVEQAMVETGTPILLYQGLRNPRDQARAFRSSRTTSRIRNRRATLEQRGYPEWAKILWDVGPQPGVLGKHITNAAPGESYHQYGLAADGCPMLDGRLVWSYPNQDPRAIKAWNRYGETAEDAGLEWGGMWVSDDKPHVQVGKGHPLETLPAETVQRWIARWTN